LLAHAVAGVCCTLNLTCQSCSHKTGGAIMHVFDSSHEK
jgi:hypothetical protein